MGSFAYHINDQYVEYGITDAKADNCMSRENALLVNCAGKVSTPENHTNRNIRQDYYLIYIISGEIEIEHNAETKLAKTGDVVVFPPNKEYAFKIFGDDEKSYLWIHFTGIDVEQKLNLYKITPFPQVNKTNTSNHINERFKKLFEGFSKNDRFKKYDISSLLDRLLIEVGRAIENQKNDRLALSKSIRYINEHFTEKIKITFLAKMENMCATTYNLRFKETMGIPPTKYIINLRVSLAKELLEFSDFSISEISLMCGYENLHFFSRVFKENTGLSPTEYRKKEIEKDSQ